MDNECISDLDLSIDPENITEAWEDQPAKMLEYSILSADAEHAVDEAKARLSLVDAQLEADIRTNPSGYGLAKTTEAAIASAVAGAETHKEASDALIEARHFARIYKAAVDALSHRKAALQGMTDLFMRTWYADPKQRTMSDGDPEKRVKMKRRVRRRDTE